MFVDRDQLTLVRLVEEAASLMVFTVFESQLTVEWLVLLERLLVTEFVSESLVSELGCRN